MTRRQRSMINKLRFREQWRQKLATSLYTDEVRYDETKLNRAIQELDRARQSLADQLAAYRLEFGCEPPDNWKHQDSL